MIFQEISQARKYRENLDLAELSTVRYKVYKLSKEHPKLSQFIFNLIARLGFRYKYVWASQATLGKWLATESKPGGYGREWVNHCIGILRELGLIHSTRRPWITNAYGIPPYLKRPKIMQFLATLFPAFREALEKNFTRLTLVSGINKKILPKVDTLMGESTYEENKSLYFRERGSPGGPGNINSFQKGDKSYKMTGNHPYTSRRDSMSDGVLVKGRMSPIIISLKELNLTKWGQIRLSAYPDGALLYAKKNMRFVLAAKDPFSHFVSLCADWCANAGLRPNFSLANELATRYKMPVDAHMVLRQIVNPAEAVPFNEESDTIALRRTESQPTKHRDNVDHKYHRDDNDNERDNQRDDWRMYKKNDYSRRNDSNRGFMSVGVSSYVPPVKPPPLTDQERTAKINALSNSYENDQWLQLRKEFGDEEAYKLLHILVDRVLKEK